MPDPDGPAWETPPSKLFWPAEKLGVTANLKKYCPLKSYVRTLFQCITWSLLGKTKKIKMICIYVLTCWMSCVIKCKIKKKFQAIIQHWIIPASFRHSKIAYNTFIFNSVETYFTNEFLQINYTGPPGILTFQLTGPRCWSKVLP